MNYFYSQNNFHLIPNYIKLFVVGSNGLVSFLFSKLCPSLSKAFFIDIPYWFLIQQLQYEWYKMMLSMEIHHIVGCSHKRNRLIWVCVPHATPAPGKRARYRISTRRTPRNRSTRASLPAPRPPTIHKKTSPSTVERCTPLTTPLGTTLHFILVNVHLRLIPPVHLRDLVPTLFC